MRWPFTTAKPTQAVSDANARPATRFAFKLFGQLVAAAATQNIIVSPASVMLCLGMFQEGATGETREAIAETLEIAELGSAAAHYLKSALHLREPSMELVVANSLWCDERFTPRSEYAANLREYFEAEINVLDFRAPESVAKINTWVSERTRGKIGHILEVLDPLLPLIAVNAIFFKDLWSRPFEKELTREEIFHTGDGRRPKVPLMRGSGFYSYCEESEFQAVRLNYKNSRLAMYIFLPDKSSSLQKLLRKLSPGAWEEKMKHFESREGHLSVPRFKVSYGTELSDALKQLGMGAAFDPQRANFDGIKQPPPQLWIGQVLHQVMVDVNEEGTEAAAVTIGMIAMSLRSPKRPRPFHMIVDRPFFFGIRDEFTDTILFMGAVGDPSS